MILGIDPGLHGAVACYEPVMESLVIYDMPVNEITSNGKKRLFLNAASLAAQLSPASDGIEFAVLENVHSMPAQGVASSFKFGRVFGAIEGVLAALKIPVRYVEPSVWKRAYELTADKDASRRRASERLPAHAALWARKKDDGRAESALLALYGWTYFREGANRGP